MERPEEIIRRALKAFETRGTTRMIEPSDLASEIDRTILAMTQVSLSRALTVSRRFARFAPSAPLPVKLSSYRALARAALMSSQYAEARDAYLKARALVKDDRTSAGRIDRTLADVYMYLGDFTESRRRALLALRTFTRIGDKAEIAKAKVNFANLLHRQDKHRTAEQYYREAADYFESVGDDLSTARCKFNQANTLVQLFSFEEAEQLYRESEEVYRRHGHQLDAVDALWGRSWLHMLQGVFHQALQELAECEQAYNKIGRPLRVASCILDRAEIFLNLNLFEDARICAIEAGNRFRRLKIRYEAAKATYYRAVAAQALGKNDEAVRAMNIAKRAFEVEGNKGFAGASLLLAAQLSDSPTVCRRYLKQATRLFSRAQLPLWSAVADVHASFDTGLERAALNRLSHNGAARQVPHLYAAWQTRLGDAKARSRRFGEAARHWTLAADRLDQIRAQLPPVGLRSKYASRSQSPHSRLVLANLEQNPALAAVWSERFKTAGIWRPTTFEIAASPARRRIEESLLALAGRYSSMSAQIGGDGERSIDLAKSSSQMSRLQRQVQMELLEIEERGSIRPTDNDWLSTQFAQMSRVQPIVQFHSSEGGLVAFVHNGNEVRAVRLDKCRHDTSSLLAQWNFLLETAALSAHLPAGADQPSEDRFFDLLGEYVWKPLDIPANTRRLLLLIDGPLTNLPWQAIRVDGEPLVGRHELVHAPSLRHYLHATRPRIVADNSAIFVGSRSDLPAITSELESIERALGPDTLLFDPCRREDWPTDGKYNSWHFSGHGRLNELNPFYSALQMNDGPLFAVDFRLRQAQVNVVTLAACETGFQVVSPGEESTGLVRSLLEMGARSVVASQWPVADSPTAHWMGLFYKQLMVDNKPMAAARHASLLTRQKYPSAYHWAAFSVNGAAE